MSKMELRKKTRNKEVKTFVGLKSVALGMGRWGVEPVFKKEMVEQEVACMCVYNAKAVLNNILFATVSLIKN